MFICHKRPILGICVDRITRCSGAAFADWQVNVPGNLSWLRGFFDRFPVAVYEIADKHSLHLRSCMEPRR
ncbi:hypothetical protein HZ326_24376 [Fusarium oxysporum f. sp. albedinis]|nr:hypothetical protein HZ326_24376 [Fusarium oxysporum f. sp. albedinis]